MKLLCCGLRPALTGFAASGRAGACSNAPSVCARLSSWPLFALSGVAHMPPRPPAGYSFATLILAPAHGRSRVSLRAATTFGGLRPLSLVAPPALPIGRRRLTPPLGAGLRTGRAQSGRDSPLLGPRFALPAGPLVASGWRFRSPLRTRPCVSLLCTPPFSPSPSFLRFIIALRSARLFGFLLVPPPIGAGSVVARCPCRAPAPGVLPGAPSRTRLKALPSGGRGVGAYAPVFFIGWRTHLRAAFLMVSP